MRPVISVIVCTRDRADSLRETLASLVRCQVRADTPAEILVVDNASTDHTPGTVRQAPGDGLPVRYVHEGRKGQSHARNRGLAETSGRVILFTDDDVRVPVGWVQGMSEPILAGAADATTGEIRIAPHLFPSWITKDQRADLLEIPDLTEQHRQQPFMIGANMGFGRHVLEKVRGFNPDLGPGALGFMDETLFYLQLIEAGYRIRFVSGLGVEHHFDPARLTRDSQMRMAHSRARSGAYVAHHWFHQTVPWRRLRMLQNVLRIGVQRVRWELGPKLGWDHKEMVCSERFWNYREMGRLAAKPYLYEKKALAPKAARDAGA